MLYMQSLSNIMDASMEDLARCPGIGDRKVENFKEKNLHNSPHIKTKKPFNREDLFTCYHVFQS